MSDSNFDTGFFLKEHSLLIRVGHRVLLRSERIVLLRSFLSFWPLMRPQKNVAFFCILFLRTQENACSFLKNALSFIKNARELMFFYKEYTRAQENAHSFEKNAKERKRTRFLLQRAQKNACPTLVLFFNIYI